MSTLTISLVILFLIIGGVIWNKVPVQFILIFTPVIGAYILIPNIEKISSLSLNFMNKTMSSVGFMMIFGLVYFTMLSATGMFETIVNQVMKLFKGRINNLIIMILTVIIAIIAMLTATPTAAYLIIFPIMVSLYDQTGFDKRVAMIVAQTAIAPMCFLPWGQGLVTSSIFAGVSPLALSKAVIPISFCFIPVIIGQILFFSHYLKKNKSSDDSSKETRKIQNKDTSLQRPKLFWINLIIFILVIIALAVLKLPSYLVFAAGAFLTTMIDYPSQRDYRKLWLQASKPIFNLIFMLISISVFVGIFNGTGMTKAISVELLNIFPHSLLRYSYLIILSLAVIIVRFLPYQLFNSLYPIFVSVGKSFGLSSLDVIAPFVDNLALATGSSPLTPATIVGTSLLGIDLDNYVKLAVPVQTVSNIAVIIIGLILGVIK
ncbi:CitMHS family citrate-Mg2+:H+ or citrate-Ca2+:H+ symporter [Lactobacillus colini]|uniref:CitMHS family citrate-Mg2+:H+ or citrate-Ca2+:H+ symporter n=1 Tax=Lactobacillus colini TaxID=1819254 RepID=A0ABS4MCK1_9LACO|nr:SLC13 family permease [Lactobacillus colini]MBP2057122.1 CitMHS family citrate-Mg2+:H+ or citrate-Ca2+:H+ symporter [Lactobacillus colini]